MVESEKKKANIPSRYLWCGSILTRHKLEATKVLPHMRCSFSTGKSCLEKVSLRTWFIVRVKKNLFCFLCLTNVYILLWMMLLNLSEWSFLLQVCDSTTFWFRYHPVGWVMQLDLFTSKSGQVLKCNHVWMLRYVLSLSLKTFFF